MTYPHTGMHPHAFAANMCPYCNVTVGQPHAIGCPKHGTVCGAIREQLPLKTAQYRPHGLTVDAAIAALIALRDEGQGASVLVVEYKPGAATMGATPATPIIGINAGFDWDNGRVFMTTGQTLSIAGVELEQLRNHAHAQAKTLHQVSRVLTDIKLTTDEKLHAITIALLAK